MDALVRRNDSAPNPCHMAQKGSTGASSAQLGITYAPASARTAS